ncbi:MAG: hypothetical protein EPO35_02155 [Acidobacteria bacterium]|nr:MAG: hypothetical protein EPO35_02155 [Acidobacteriota bacterium]
MRIVSVLALSAFLTLPPAPAPGILLLAHGGSDAWNQNVRDIAAATERAIPTEVALGMASRAEIQGALDRLVARGVTSVVAVPLFVSSHSSVITSTEYLLGLRAEMPDDLKIFAAMAHGGGHAGHVMAPDPAATTPVVRNVPVRMSPALDAHPIVASILAARAASISRSPEDEAVIIVAHGPVDDETNARWLADLRITAGRLAAAKFHSVDAITVRDDAPAAIRDAATGELRALVEERAAGGRRVLIVPALLSFGGIEAGIRKRLEGLAYTMTDRGLAPDDRLAAWVLEMAVVK